MAKGKTTITHLEWGWGGLVFNPCQSLTVLLFPWLLPDVYMITSSLGQGLRGSKADNWKGFFNLIKI